MLETAFVHITKQKKKKVGLLLSTKCNLTVSKVVESEPWANHMSHLCLSPTKQLYIYVMRQTLSSYKTQSQWHLKVKREIWKCWCTKGKFSYYPASWSRVNEWNFEICCAYDNFVPRLNNLAMLSHETNIVFLLSTLFHS